MKPFDLVFLALSLTLTAGTAWAVLAPTNTPLRLEVQTDKALYSYPLEVDQTVKAEGPLGITLVHIEKGTIHVEDSPCTNKVCIAMGTIRSSGQWVACLPNHVFVRITGGAQTQDSVDAGVF
ncbi:MAG: NusG domain II-containing protein [Spirochaetales bacterium]